MAATKVGFRRSFEIAGRQVGDGAPAYVIAEAGANHNRDLDMAKQLIDVAAEAGADAVKFQTYTGKDLYSSKTPRFEYLDDERSPQELLDAIALPREWQPELAEHAQGRGIAFFSSPFDRDAVDSLVEARRAGAEDRVVRARRPAADLVRGADRPPGHPLDRDGDLRRDRGRARRGRGGRATTRSRCCAAPRSIRPSPRS